MHQRTKASHCVHAQSDAFFIFELQIFLEGDLKMDKLKQEIVIASAQAPEQNSRREFMKQTGAILCQTLKP